MDAASTCGVLVEMTHALACSIKMPSCPHIEARPRYHDCNRVSRSDSDPLMALAA